MGRIGAMSALTGIILVCLFDQIVRAAEADAVAGKWRTAEGSAIVKIYKADNGA
jgi:uncharacterized protein (DUF2147 family)